MIRFFRAVIRRDNGDDPVFCNFKDRDILSHLRHKLDLGRVKKFQINRENYVALGLITDLDSINEDDLKIEVSYLQSSCKLLFKEHQYSNDGDDILPLKEGLYSVKSLMGDIGDLIFTSIETKKEMDPWRLYVANMKTYRDNKELINIVLKSELNYGRKRKKFITSN